MKNKSIWLMPVLTYWVFSAAIWALGVFVLGDPYVYIIPMHPWAYSSLLRSLPIGNNFVIAFALCLSANSILIGLISMSGQLVSNQSDDIQKTILKRVIPIWLILWTISYLSGLASSSHIPKGWELVFNSVGLYFVVHTCVIVVQKFAARNLKS